MTPDAIGTAVRDGLRRGEPVRLALPDDGVVFVDHAVPVLAVHRCAPAHEGADAPATCTDAHTLVTTQPAYVVASGPDVAAARDAIRAVAEALAGAGTPPLVVEVWTPLDAEHDDGPDPFDRAPGFTLFTTSAGPDAATVEALRDALSGIEVAGQGASVDHIVADSVAPPGLVPLEVPGALGLAVDAVFVNARDGEFYPRVLAEVRDALAPALRDAAAARASVPLSEVGRATLEPAALAVDAGLAEVASSFGLLLQITPVNGDAAWEEFRTTCDRAPEFVYRPLAYDPDAARRTLFSLPLDQVEDPVVAGLLRESRDEIADHVRMTLDVDTPQFLPTSLRVYGAPDDGLVALARQLLSMLDDAPPRPLGSEVVGATAFAAAARVQLDAYGAVSADVPQAVQIRDDIPGSLMVSDGRLLIGAHTRIPAARVEALLAHEVGTHVLTFANGAAQPLRMLRYGLAGYQDLQEGLAVLAEWLVGGLTAGRFRTLAARVLGARALAEGADFVETFRVLTGEAGLSDRAAFTVTLRLYRGGGLTKDMVYLRGLRDLLAHLGDGHPLWPLFLGKIALRHVPAIADLRARGVLYEPPLRPLHADAEATRQRLARLRGGLTLLDLLTPEA
ncbi:flavohemoglobin expression-modulating QEGLA motif protein [Rubrivirga sp. IMCC45206]|uniref:flavohemoglobin expression-modulating QEGLA motif protein n=1 Tax=Rubrivirga sp. IMCC45206 TaxID=3391614 RepID=UPI003990037E